MIEMTTKCDETLYIALVYDDGKVWKPLEHV